MDVRRTISKLIKDSTQYSSVVFEDNDDLFSFFLEDTTRIDGKSLVRIAREELIVRSDEMAGDHFYHMEIAQYGEHPILKRDPSFFYKIDLICSTCGSCRWVQHRDLTLKESVPWRILQTENGEILIDNTLKAMLEAFSLDGISFRKTNIDSIYQLIVNSRSTAIESDSLIKNNYCSSCKSPRIVKIENSNGIPFIDRSEKRIEMPALLEFADIRSEISLSDLDFGTIGRIPEGVDISPDIMKDVTFKTAFPVLLVSGRLIKEIQRKQEVEIVVKPIKYRELS